MKTYINVTLVTYLKTCLYYIRYTVLTCVFLLFFQSTLDDYDAVPVQEFGLAMLRGMGWTPGQARYVL